MTLPTTTLDISEDTLTLSDISIHSTPLERGSCPYCGGAINNHALNDDLPEHEHMTIGESQVCRRLYECQGVLGNSSNAFYSYQVLGASTRWVLAAVTETSSETVDDTENLQFGRKKLAEPIKPLWRFKTKLATKTDYVDYLAHNLIMGLEMEFDFKDESNPITESRMSQVFGVHPTDYHHHPACPVCGSGSCWNHLPTNLIRGIERDASIQGLEFIIYGSRISSDEFARRLPLDKMKQHFVVNERDGLHIHAMLVHDIEELPTVIVKNLWQLFRWFYPAYVNLFGNYSASQGFLRHSSYNGHDYVTFKSFNKTPFSNRWARDMTDREHARCGLFLINTPLETETMTTFDIEIRTNDATMDMEQLIAARAIPKAMILRAAQLSTYGLISVESNKDTWETVKSVVAKIGNRNDITPDDISFMRKHSIALLRELAPFLTELERTCIKHLIERPVRERENRLTTAADIVPEISETAKQLKKIISITSIEANDEQEWFGKVARIMGLSVSEVKTALRQLKAYFDVDTKTMELVG